VSTLALSADAARNIEVTAAKNASEQAADVDTPFRSPGGSLVLTRDQLKQVVEFAIETVKKYSNDMDKWCRHRDHWLEEHDNDFYHRAQAGSIYEKSNVSFNQSKRITMPIIARLTKDYLGTDPFFSITPIRNDQTPDDANKLQDWGAFKLGNSNLHDALEDAIEMAAVVGERVVKIAHREDIEFFMETDTVLVGPDQEPIRTTLGEPIYHDDVLIDQEVPMDPEEMGLLQKAGQMMGMNPTKMVQVPQKDPQTIIPPDAEFQRTTYEMHKVNYAGPDFHGINHRDFICPLNVEDIQEAPLIAHKYDRFVTEVVEQYAGPDVDDTQFDPQEKAFFLELMENLKKLAYASSEAQSEQDKPVHYDGETSHDASDKYVLRTGMAEVYTNIDPIGDGRLREIVITIDLKNRFAYSFDYTANTVAPGVLRPFRVVRINPVKNRWYGSSEYKLNKHNQETIDYFLNRQIWDNSIAGKFRLYDREACEGWDERPPQPGETLHTLKPGKDPERAIITIDGPALSDGGIDLMKMFMQQSQASTGNLSPGGDTLSQLPSSKLKYGIQAIERSGDEAYALKAICCKKGLEDTTKAGVATAVAYMSPTESFTYNDASETKEGIINKTQVEAMKFTVALQLTLTRGDQINEQNEQATQIVLTYMGYPPQIKLLVRDFLIARLKSMDIQQADKALPSPTPEEIAAAQQQAAMAAATPQPGAQPSTPPPTDSSGQPAEPVPPSI